MATLEALAAASILRERVPDLKLRFVNVVDLFKLQPASEHPHGSTEREFDGLFTTDKPIIFNFHGYPWLIHKLAYRFKGHENLHVRGYKEKGNINTPFELAMLNETVALPPGHRRRSIACPSCSAKAAHLKEEMKNAIIDNLQLRARARHRPPRDHRLDLAGLSRDDGAEHAGRAPRPECRLVEPEVLRLRATKIRRGVVLRGQLEELSSRPRFVRA